MMKPPPARCAGSLRLALAGLALACAAGGAQADPPAVIDSNSIIRSLSPAAGTTTRGFTVEARSSAAAGSGGGGGGGKVNLDIRFANDSNQLTPAADAQLSQLGAALNAPALAQARFLIAGHTSATGDPKHNQQLSEHRARAVRTYLLEHFSIAPQRIETRGYGSSHPLPQYAPTAQEQRRVEISTLP